MSIPIYTESPISPAKATAITPQTNSAPPSPYTPATTTATPTAASSTSAYESARPVAVLPTPTQTTSIPSTATTSLPPAPQPGALPTPFVPKSRTPSPRREIPPPPKVGEKAQPPSYYSPTPTPTYFASPQPFPSQMGFANPSEPRSAGVPPASTTAHQNGYSSLNNGYGNPNGLLSPQSARLPYGQPPNGSAYNSPAQTPTTANDVRRSFEHPPGYVQNPYAADMTPEQRFATQHSPGSPSLGWNSNGTAKSPGIMGIGGLGSPTGGLGGILNGGGASGDESVWGIVGGWMKGVGKKVGEVEGEVWRRINGE